ncbi:hypothetical protein H2199_003627 [Coniosporium tulheliwenetii]|uniref:Uncharacterized protein n=1 Tax=Coniosporium tulheliwenetii TaxID=3383036 RepID=A0ACC2ZAF3_9PEZI|nr:hypothetical protein H2199_003627 [Cladosporium sp. JES 115]
MVRQAQPTAGPSSTTQHHGRFGAGLGKGKGTAAKRHRQEDFARQHPRHHEASYSILKEIGALLDHCKKQTVTVDHVVWVLKRLGSPIYGFDHLTRRF